VSEVERAQVLEFVKERLVQYSFSREPQVFSVSARQALEGKQSANDELVEPSGIRQLEEALFRFLTEEKAEAFLANIHNRISAFLMQTDSREDSPEHREILDGLLARLLEFRAPTRERSDEAVPVFPYWRPRWRRCCSRKAHRLPDMRPDSRISVSILEQIPVSVDHRSRSSAGSREEGRVLPSSHLAIREHLLALWCLRIVSCARSSIVL